MVFKNPGEKKFEKLNDFQTAKIDLEMGPLPETKKGIIGILKALQKTHEHWQIALPMIIENERDIVVKEMMMLNVVGGVRGIISKYKLVNCELRKVRIFAESADDPRVVFQWNTIFTRIFFKYLEHGGQEYYAFCERCGNFTSVVRKGRKRFCSDLCRVYGHQEKTGKCAKNLSPIRSTKVEKRKIKH